MQVAACQAAGQSQEKLRGVFEITADLLRAAQSQSGSDNDGRQQQDDAMTIAQLRQKVQQHEQAQDQRHQKCQTMRAQLARLVEY